MSIKLNSTSGGSVSLDPVASLASDITLTLPNGVGSAGQILKNGSTAGTLEFADGGKVLQVKSSYTTRTDATSLDISQPTTPLPSALYGFVQASRTYADLNTITITPKSSTSTLILMGTAGAENGNRSSRGADGVVFVKDNTTGYQGGSYPRYDSGNQMQMYPEDKTLIIPVASGNTNSQTWYFKGYAYNEGAGSGTHVYPVLNTSFVILEVEA